jgi:hypothetical protein
MLKLEVYLQITSKGGKQMTRRLLTFIGIIVAVWFLTVGPALAVPVMGTDYPNLQKIFDDITVGGVSGINVTTDFLPDDQDSYWSLTSSGISTSRMIIEVADWKDENTFGVFRGSDYVELFSGADTAGKTAVFEIQSSGEVFVNFLSTGTFFGANLFGYYLGTPDGIFHSDTALNADGIDHMLAYQGNNIDVLKIGNLMPGLWTSSEYILAFEDIYGGGDFSYNDMVVMVGQVTPGVNPVPEPGTLLLLGSGMLGLAAVRKLRRG